MWGNNRIRLPHRPRVEAEKQETVFHVLDI